MKRQPFDENFLMAVATIGAFAIGDYPEAVAVMLFSRIGEAMEDRAVNRSRKQVAAAIDMRPEVVHRVTADGSTVTIRPRTLLPVMSSSSASVTASPWTVSSWPAKASSIRRP